MAFDDPSRSLSARLREAIVGAGPLLVITLLLLVVAALVAAYRWLDPTPERRLVIATGPEQGAYAEFAKRYQPLLRANGVTVELRVTQGSSENLSLLRALDSGVQAAFVQGGVDAPAEEADTALRSLGSVAVEPLWLFYSGAAARKRLGQGEVNQLSQLRGWRVNTGAAGSGGRALFLQLAAANGLDGTSMQLSDKATVQAVVDLLQGRIDALLLVSAADAPLVQYLLQTPQVQLLDFAQAEAYARRFPFLRALTLPRGVIDLAADRPARDVHLVGTTTSLVVRDDLHPALVQLLVQAAADAHDDAGWFHRADEFPNPTAGDIALASEAQRFYRDGVPWLQRHLPFWLANFIERMWIVVLPLVAVMIPLSRLLPPLIELRVRSRVYRWYAHLRALERSLEAPDADHAALRKALERIDAQVERVGVPLAYTHELYELRSHIHLVRKRLLGAAAHG